MSFRKDDTAGVVGSYARYFSIQVPTRADADGLIVESLINTRTLKKHCALAVHTEVKQTQEL